MKTIVITDPCYTDGGKKDIDDHGDWCKVTLEVTDEFFEVLKQKPIVEFNPEDNWDGGTYFFGGKYPIESYKQVGNHCNDAGMTCIADYENIKGFDWHELCDVWFKASATDVTCPICNGTGKKDKVEEFKEKYRKICSGDEEFMELFGNCDCCYGKGVTEGRDHSATLNDYGHFLMLGDTFLGDVGATVYAHYNDKNEIDALALDVVGYTFSCEDEEEYDEEFEEECEE